MFLLFFHIVAISSRCSCSLKEIWLDLGYSHFLKILPFVQHICIWLELVALGLEIAHFISSRQVWTQLLMIHLKRLCLAPGYLPFLKIFGKIFAIVASGEEKSIKQLAPNSYNSLDLCLFIPRIFKFSFERIVESPKNVLHFFPADVSRIFSFQTVRCELCVIPK